MAYVVTYSAMFGTVSRAFTTRGRAEVWQRSVAPSGTIREDDCVRFYRCRAYRGKWQLFPAAEVINCGHFLNARHFEQLLRLWSGRAGSVRYEYDDIIGDYDDVAEILDQRGYRPEFARPEFSVAS